VIEGMDRGLTRRALSEMPLRVTRDASRVLGPIYHWTEPRVRAHVTVCFLALLLEVELERRLREQGVGASFREVLSDLVRVKAVHLEVKGKPYLARTELSGQAYQGFRAAGVAVPPRVVEL